MQIGIGLPATIPGVSGSLILDWARRADAGPFSSLAVLDRVVYPNLEPLVTLAAVASVTRRARLMTSVLVAPLRNAGLFAKQAASLDNLSDGRLTLGLAVGGRENDFRAAPASFRNRGRRFDEQLEMMKRIWAGEPATPDTGLVGPRPARPSGPEVLIGGYSTEEIARRVARWGDGYIVGSGATPERARDLYRGIEKAWRVAGRSGEPRLVAARFYALGPNAAESAAAYLRDYYAFLGPGVETLLKAVPTSREAIDSTMQVFREIGVDELLFWPCIPHLDQVDRLADVVS